MVLGMAVLAGRFSEASAQQPSADRRPLATRAELEALWASLKPQQRAYAEAVVLRERLDKGDFQIGDKVILHVRGDTSLTNTFTVNANRGLDLPNIGEISLVGVLRSELETHLQATVSKYIRSLDLRAESLVRLAVLGSVGRPGFYNVSSAALMGDVFTAAGGLTAGSDLGHSEIRRGGQPFMESDKVQRAISEGRTVDQINLLSGDEIQVAEKRRGSVASTVLLVGAIAGALLSIVAVVSLVK
jgi:protein involved in polysaccharide export with SLBB domain